MSAGDDGGDLSGDLSGGGVLRGVNFCGDDVSAGDGGPLLVVAAAAALLVLVFQRLLDLLCQLRRSPSPPPQQPPLLRSPCSPPRLSRRPRRLHLLVDAIHRHAWVRLCLLLLPQSSGPPSPQPPPWPRPWPPVSLSGCQIRLSVCVCGDYVCDDDVHHEARVLPSPRQ